ncbi:MAG: multicopper oxidase domain-containing protein [Blastocatellia bacterium]
MAKSDERELQEVEAAQAAPATKAERIRATRRQFLQQALAVTSGIALAEILPPALLAAEPQGATCPTGLPELVKVQELDSQGTGKLQAVIKVLNGNRVVPGRTDNPMLRYFAGFKPTDLRNPVWPDAAQKNNVGPGPTLRCEIGDSVQITLLNEVNVGAFQGSLYSGEQGSTTGCDEVTKAGSTATTDTNWYPANDLYPNCFHASSASNLHFHGTHVTPSTTGDNILVNIQPQANLTPDKEKQIVDWFEKGVFSKGEAVKSYNELPDEWRKDQMGPANTPEGGLVGQYDKTAPFNGGNGLPDKLKLWPKNDATIKAGEWPQYFVGSYPICFRVPRYKKGDPALQMGQAPGTHWYHAHKHGSTSVNLFNGMAGALIITDNQPGGYDRVLREYYGEQGGLPEKVLVFQQIGDTIEMMVANQNAVAAPPLFINGQKTPVIKMRPGQTQLWRMINATVSTFLTGQFVACGTSTGNLNCRQTAQDGVQLSRSNYAKQVLGNTGQTPIASTQPMAPGNRIDLLVQAPRAAGTYVMQTIGNRPAPLLYVSVEGTEVFPRNFPAEGWFPDMPEFLRRDITAEEVQVRRELNYGTYVPNIPGQLRQPPLRIWTINGKQFEDGVINQQIKLGAVEEWTIFNTTTQAAHPFHIHVNPFQVVEIYDPNTMTAPLRLQPPFVWWDTFPIPKAKQDSKTKNVIASGYFKMRSRFVDFTGLYVNHCHILGHEDRGMMQLVEVCKDLANCGTHTHLSHH